MTDPSDARYLSQVRRSLFCPRSDKKRLLQKCRTFLEKYRQENPDAAYDDVVADFGSPPDLADALMTEVCPNQPQEARIKYINRQRFWLRVAVCLGALAIAAFVGYAIWVANNDFGYIIKTVTTDAMTGG